MLKYRKESSNMRLLNDDIKAIKQTFLEVFKQGNIFLFGSRVNDSLKGGDIDLYIVPTLALDRAEILDKKINFLVKLKSLIGDQKIDVIVSKDQNRLIEKEALHTGIQL